MRAHQVTEIAPGVYRAHAGIQPYGRPAGGAGILPSRRLQLPDRRPPSAYLRLQWLGPLLTNPGISPKYVVTDNPGWKPRRSGRGGMGCATRM
jgi:hypothetical protein